MTMITRRTFNGLAGTAGVVSALGLSACAGTGGGADTASAKGPRVVVVGGGFGGATAAKYVRKMMPEAQVTLIEANKKFYTCPFSNTVLGGFHDMAFIEKGYDALAGKWGVKVVHDMVVDIDAAGKKVKTKGGDTFAFDRCIVSPGIDFKPFEGYDEAASQLVPHAWKAGPQTALLRKQLEAMPDGGVVLIGAPANPFRCPPGPYERASLIAWYLKNNKPKSKIIILDAKDAFSKQGLFMEGWKKLYGDMIEWVPANKNGKVAKVHAKDLTLETDFDKHKGAVVNFIPQQSAGAIAVKAGLTDASGFCPVDHISFESKIHPGIHVIGDASIAGSMPKSGYSASSQGKIAAAGVVALLKGGKPTPPVHINTCYSLVSPDYGISVVGVYQLNDKGVLADVKGAGGVSPAGANNFYRRKEADYAEGWYASISQDSWG